MKTLQEQYIAIKNGKGNKAQFVKQARSLFPEYFNQYTDFDTATNVLKSKQIISEAAGGVVAKGFDIWDWKKILAEETKAVEKKTSKEVLDDQKNNYNNSDMKNADNVNFNEIMKGFYAEMKDEKNADKTGDELKAMVVKNLAKDPLYYTKNGMFGVKGVGYTTEAPGLGEPKAPKGKHKSSGYGDLKENKEKRELSLQLVDKEDKKGLALYKNTKDQNDLYYYDGKVLYSVRDDGSKGPSVRMSLFNITGLKENKEKIKLQESFFLNLEDAKEEAQRISKEEGVVQHVNTDGEGYSVEDWYDSDNTVVSYEGGRQLEENIKSIKENTDVLDYYASTIEANNMSEDEAYAYLEDLNLPSFQINQIINYVFPIDEALYQGPSVKLGAGGSLGGRRFIPTFTALSRDAVDAINAKGSKRLGWGKPHIKIMKSGDGIKLLVSKLLVDTIVGSERGRSKLSLAVSKMGTGITPEEMSELTGEFKKLIKVLSASGKLTQNGDYFLLDVPTKYNEKYNKFEMPLPADVAENLAEQKLRSLIRNIIKEEMDWDRFNIQVSSDNYEGTIKRDSEGWMMYDEDNQPEEAGPFKTLDSLMSYYDLSKDDLIGDYVKKLNENLIPHDKITYDDKGKEVKKERLFLDKKHTIKGKDLTPDERYEYAMKGISVEKNQEVKPLIDNSK